MSFLVTADLQAEWGNLDLCTESWDEMLHICKKYDIKTIVFAGDGKEAYDPVSIRVVKWWQKSIHRAVDLGIRVFYVRGNHDRIATYSIAGDWLSILRHAGAQTFSRPGVVTDGNRRLFMLPYESVKQTKKWAEELLKHKPDRRKDVLFFHCNLLEARYSQHGQYSNSVLSVHDLSFDSYRFCIGGDIHLPQKIEGNVYYVGSSFCHDWGEVNQRKRYIVCRENEIISMHSQIPRWFDPNINGFRRAAPPTWKGSRVRISVPCDASENYERRLNKARRDAERKYKGAELYIVPKFNEGDGDQPSTIKSSDTDESKLRRYIESQSTKQQGSLEYMLEKLSHFSHGLRTGSRFKFKWAKAKNYLCYEELKFNFRQKGIIVVKGVNHDRNKKSNGSGKTSLTNMIPVAWFGRTFKGQAHDKWSNRFNPKKQAYVEVCGEDVKGNEIRVLRGRRPTELKLLVNNHNQSSGMKSTDQTGTQAQIEQVTGFTWPTLANAVYIDRSICDAFLSGTNAQRTAVLSRFQNLERFEKALKLVKKDISENNDKYYSVKEKLSRVRGQIEECTHSLHELKEVQKEHVKAAYEKYRAAKSRYHKHLAKKERHKLEKEAKRVAEAYEHALKVQTEQEKQLNKLEEAFEEATRWVVKWKNLEREEYCPTCYQDITHKAMHTHIKKAQKKLKQATREVRLVEQALTKTKQNTQLLEGEHDEIQSKLSHIDRDISHYRLLMDTALTQHRELASSHHGAYTIISKTKSKLRQFEQKKEQYKIRKEKLRKRGVMYAFAVSAFSRDGIPAFLNRQLCPVLNKASDYYSELFSNKEIQVRFKVEGGEFVPQIINAKGGEHLKDQSEGEHALAGLISSFALREAAPETNLLILDEPGSGLDEQTAKQFARSLKVLNKRFKLILVTTHNPVILGALEGEQEITVVKKDGISRIKEAV